MKHKIAVIPGDGIGKEVLPEGMRVLDAAATRFGFELEWTTFDWSCERYTKTGRMMPEDGLDQLRAFEAIFLGAVGFPGVPDHVSLWGLLIPIRRTFHQYVNLRPVRLLLGDARLILLSPDGELNLLPFGVLVDEESHYLVERLTFITLTTGRDLLRLTAKNASRQGPLIVANPDFDSPSSSVVVSLASAGLGVGAHRLEDWSDPRFASLEGTAGEATALKRLLPEATVLTGAAATETALKQIQGPRILHIATHGFFVANHEEDVLKGLGFVELHSADSLKHPVPPRWENPLLRSGLALAGANQQGGEDEDGMLTALEAAGLDLWGTKLVVLSACETGMGDIQNGEGVYGLRRAIGMAGAESQVMSLWKVGDSATQDLMVAYYANLILGEGRAEGLRHVQLQMLHSTRWNHPFYWASFIQSGDWTPIEELQPDLSVQGIVRALSARFYHHCPSLFCW